MKITLNPPLLPAPDPEVSQKCVYSGPTSAWTPTTGAGAMVYRYRYRTLTQTIHVTSSSVYTVPVAQSGALLNEVTTGHSGRADACGHNMKMNTAFHTE